MLVRRRSSSTNRCRPCSCRLHRIGVVHRLKTRSTTGAIGHASSGSASTWPPSQTHYYPLGTYYPHDTSVSFGRANAAAGQETAMFVVIGATGNVGRPLVSILAS